MNIITVVNISILIQEHTFVGMNYKKFSSNSAKSAFSVFNVLSNRRFRESTYCLAHGIKCLQRDATSQKTDVLPDVTDLY